jgi:dTDP-4-dehydrorhamnose 3,5-epimerase
VSKIKIIETGFDDLKIIECTRLGDARGYFMESYNYRDMKNAGIDIPFVQDNQSRSKRGVLRGLHFQNSPHAQTKLVRVLAGVILDVVLDLRREKSTFGKVYQLEMTADNNQQLLVPKGFAHGFIVLSNSADILYKSDEFHYPEQEGGILYSDPSLAIDWKISEAERTISDRDKKHPLLKEGKFYF